MTEVASDSRRLLLVAPLHAAADVMARRAPSHIVSLCAPADDVTGLPARPDAQHLRLCFNDIAEAREGLVAPDSRMVGEFLAFARAWDGMRPLLVHCWAGISRSCAVAYVLACDRNAEREHELALELRRRAPFATPNPLVVKLADDILGRSGRMVEAIRHIGRGAEAPHGEPFEFPA